jgi:hypothetical protein
MRWLGRKPPPTAAGFPGYIVLGCLVLGAGLKGCGVRDAIARSAAAFTMS